MDDWLTTKEAARLLKMSPGTLFNWRAEGRGPTFRNLGRAVRYSRQEIEQWIRGEETKRDTQPDLEANLHFK